MAYFVGAYWGQREESRQACAVRISAFLCELTQLDVALSLWFKMLNSRKEPLVALPNDPDGLEPLLRVNKTDIGDKIFTELGFSFSAWTGREADMGASLSVKCGGYWTPPHRAVLI